MKQLIDNNVECNYNNDREYPSVSADKFGLK